MPFKVHGLTQEFRALHTYSVITNSLHIHKLGVVRWGGVVRAMVSRTDASGAVRVQCVAQGHCNHRYVCTLTV